MMGLVMTKEVSQMSLSIFNKQLIKESMIKKC